MLRTASTRAAALTLVLTAFVAGAAHGEGIKLAHRFVLGEQVIVDARHEAVLNITENEQETEVSHTTESERVYVVKSIDATGAATVVSRVDSVVMTASSSNVGAISYDSRSDKEPPEQFAPVAETVGKPLARFVVSAKGQVDLVTPLLKGVITSDASSQAHEHPFFRLPDEPVEVGDTWSETFKLVIKLPEALPEAVRVKRVYRLDEVQEQVASISWTCVALTPIRDSRIEGELAQRTLDGTLTFNIKSGKLIKRAGTRSSEVVGFRGGGSMLRSEIEREETTRVEVARGSTATTR